MIFRLEYLRHAKCYRNISMDREKCAEKYKIAVEVSGSLDGKDVSAVDKEDVMKRSCW